MTVHVSQAELLQEAAHAVRFGAYPDWSLIELLARPREALQLCDSVRAGLRVAARDEEILGALVRQEAPAGCWVPVEVEVPDDDRLVLVYVPETETRWPGFLTDGKWHFGEGDEIERTVTHWSELPAPPAERSDA